MISDTMKSQSEAKWTAGPWHLIGSRGSGFSVHATVETGWDSDALARCNNASLDTNEANARLISQAPEMIQALELALCYMEADGDDEQEREDYANFSAIIARAKGEKP